MYRIGFDVGGTFTDFTVHDARDGSLRYFKTPSTPSDPSEAIETGLRALFGEFGIAAQEVSFVGHGTTVATNMVIERRGVRTGLITTKGFRDVLEIGRQTRPSLYDYSVANPPLLVPRALRIEVAERIDAAGDELLPLDEEAVAAAARRLGEAGVKAVGICFLHAYLRDAHERRAAEIVRGILPDAYVSTSSEVLPEFREYERFSTTVINAYVGPRMERYLERFLARLNEIGATVPPYTIHSNGGLMSVETVRAFPVRTCLSGPAAGVVGAAEVARAAGFPDVVTYDVGGTSTDVSLIANGRPAFATSRLVADYPVRTPMVDVHVIGAGGGSIAWIDDAGALKVGPHSAGADPGPVAYGRGGKEPTLTDANIVLHRLDPVSLLGGRMEVQEAAARQAIEEKIARPLGLTVEQAALGIIRIAVANMSRAIRAVSTEKGHDLATFALFPFGGAGPLHASAVARECGIRRVLVPQEPGTMCARGILMSDISLDFVRSEVVQATDGSWPGIMDRFAGMEAQGRDWLDASQVPKEHRAFARVIDARYKGQNHEVQVALPDAGGFTLDQFRAAFTVAHRQEYGYDVPDRVIEVVNCRLKAIGAVERPATPPRGAAAGTPAPRATRSVHFDEGWRDTLVFDRAALGAGLRIPGPAIIDEMSSTTVVEPGQSVTMDAAGNLILEIAA
ncbi:hydantoinase/oxoprolinase family protein [Roseomonas eburnea]|uniref:Hydantoinase/oxoprolinase family protein n=1 Tax=Neoroseomonas eburnea TaxID=1346889 RepID=A0A9X9XC63_9PROT|nr:hydantoinase/oxoprolinase family protein [Neoroseomonas eburnea]MBR0681299.1 hydantoinase/oxoprolinase family protein [Neoroseomonas eburnea]